MSAEYTTGDDEQGRSLSYGMIGCPADISDDVRGTCEVTYTNHADWLSDGKVKLGRKMYFMTPHNRYSFMDADTGEFIYEFPKDTTIYGAEVGFISPYKLLGQCNITDIPCQLNLTEYAKFPLAGLLFGNQQGPGIDCFKQKVGEFDSFDCKPKTVTKEVIMYGNNTFSAYHNNVSYKDNIEYVDNGSLSFILGEDNEDVPLYLINRESITMTNQDDGFDNNCKVIKLNTFIQKYTSIDQGDDCALLPSSGVEVIDNKVHYTKDKSKSIKNLMFKKIEDSTITDKKGLMPAVSNIYDNSFQIQINASSHDNTVYKWNSTDLSENFPRYAEEYPVYGDLKAKMKISGYFLVELHKGKTVDNFPVQYCELQKLIAEWWVKAQAEYKCIADVIVLDPINLKDIEYSKYKN